jgi:uncharacterized membrane protein
MTRIEHMVEVNVSAYEAYEQWLRYDSYPKFMDSVIEVTEPARDRLHWRAQRHGSEIEWDSEITTKLPGQMIAWRDMGGPGNDGKVSFHALDANRCRVQMIMHVDLHAAPEITGEAEFRLAQRVEEDLARFKALMEHPEAKPYDCSSPATTGVEYATHSEVPTNELLTNTPGSPNVPKGTQSRPRTGGDGQDNRVNLRDEPRVPADAIK